jgi:hypothetical protein
MITITGYKQVGYNDFLSALNKAFADSGKKTVQIAADINVETLETARNAFSPQQKVSDKVLTKVMKSVGLSGFVIWVFGTKYYYIKNK